MLENDSDSEIKSESMIIRYMYMNSYLADRCINVYLW